MIFDVMHIVAYLSNFMTSDLIAIDDLYSSFGYGISNAFNGDTTYGFNTNIGDLLKFISSEHYCLPCFSLG